MELTRHQDTKVSGVPADWAEHSGYHELAVDLRQFAAFAE
jgi:hypothetical protein